MKEPRYFVDHDTLHDRVTGKHVSLQEAADLMSADPADVNLIAWKVVIELGKQLQQAGGEILRLQTELRRSKP